MSDDDGKILVSETRFRITFVERLIVLLSGDLDLRVLVYMKDGEVTHNNAFRRAVLPPYLEWLGKWIVKGGS
jgi:hypothetical protein